MTRSFLCFVLFIPLKKSWGYDRTDEQVGEEKGVVGVGSGFVGNHELFPLITKFHSLKKKRKTISQFWFSIKVSSFWFVPSVSSDREIQTIMRKKLDTRFPAVSFCFFFFRFQIHHFPARLIDWLIWLVGFATMFCNLIIYDFAG